MSIERTTIKPALLALAVGLLILAVAIMASTKTTKTRGMTFRENTTFKFMISVVPNDAVDITGQRFWVATSPSGVKCVAGINVPLPRQQFTLQLLSWSWKG